MRIHPGYRIVIFGGYCHPTGGLSDLYEGNIIIVLKCISARLRQP
ncbi:hypothetical protein ASZ90_008928 [hydrocarbon metagenome]|uniref:Uncharacterized protein n=1 Tax=hydrocarbon metagenome TaxID=938273 RepID=A0A0W8FKS6_9ZZZZ